MDEVKVEHHWHEPSQGQITKALYQFLADQGIGQDTLMKLCDSKLEKILAGKIDNLLNSGRMDKLICEAITASLLREKKCFDLPSGNGYGFENRIRDLVQQELQRTVLSEYQVVVQKKAAKQ